VSFRALDLSVSPPALSTLATLPAGDGEAGLYNGGGVLAGDLYFSSTDAHGYFGSGGLLSVFNVSSNALVAQLPSQYCDHLLLDGGRLLCVASAPWFWPPGVPPSNDDVAALVVSLLELDAATGQATFLASFSPGYVLSFGAPAFDAAAGALFLHVARGLSADVEVWTVDVRATPPRVVAVSQQPREQSIQAMLWSPAPRAALLAFVFTEPPSPRNFSLGLYSVAVPGGGVPPSFAPVGGAPSLYPRVASVTGAAALSGDGAQLYVVAIDDRRGLWLVTVDTFSGEAQLTLPLSAALCPSDPSPCVVGDLQWLRS
jgi:hypothetical protein